MKTIKTKTQIQAPAKVVWNVLMDFKSYPDWNPFVKEINGSPSVGQSLKVKIFNGKKDFNFQPMVLVVEPETEFRWKGKMWFKGIFDGEHYFQLRETKQQNGNVTTHLTHGENFSGLLAGILMKQIGESTETGFQNMNEALKSRSENIFAQDGV